jgi:hypothetical protein
MKSDVFFRQLNHGWNAEPNAPNPETEWHGKDLNLKFHMNCFQFLEFGEDDVGVITFKECARFRFGSLNDDAWFRGQGRFSDVHHQWGEFYEVYGDLRLGALPNDWKCRAPTVGLNHYLFYFRDTDFECDAREWELEVGRSI